MSPFSTFTSYMSLYYRSLRFVWQAAGDLALGLLITIPLQALLPSLTLYLINQLMNELASGSQEGVWLLLAWGLAFILGNAMTPLNLYLQGRLTDQLTFALNDQIMKKAESIQTLAWYEDHDFYNKIDLISSEASWRPVNLLVFGTSLISNTLLVISMFTLLSQFHWVIAVILIMVLIPQGLMAYRIQQQAFETLVANSEDSRKLSYYASVVLTADYIKEVRLYHLHGYFQNKYRQIFSQIRSAVQGNRRRQLWLSTAFLVVTGLVSVLSFAYLVQGVKSGLFAVGAIMIFATAITYTIQGVSRLVEDSSLLYDTLLYMSNFFDFLELEEETSFGNQEVPSEFDSLEFQNVSFTYPGADKATLSQVSFDMARGQKIALVGENGAGKSTLIKLLLGFYLADQGQVEFDGHNILDLDIDHYRQQFSAVFQDFAKFDLTVRENVALSRIDQVDDPIALQASLQRGGIEEGDLLTLDQTLGKRFEDSRELSGGQWQKLALARAFYSQAPILILDEPTAALDARAENQLVTKFLELAENKTVLFVTHRLAMVKKADKVLVLKDGQVVGFDHHDQLLQHNAYYADLYALQADLYREE